MKIKKKSILDGKEYVMELNVTMDEIVAYNSGVHVQHAFPNLKAEEREFIISGIKPNVWEETFKAIDDE